MLEIKLFFWIQIRIIITITFDQKSQAEIR